MVAVIKILLFNPDQRISTDAGVQLECMPVQPTFGSAVRSGLAMT